MSDTDSQIKQINAAFAARVADDKVSFATLMSFTSKTQEAVTLICNDLSYIKEDIKEIKEIMNSRYVSREEFEPIKKVVYGLLSIVLGAIIMAVVTSVTK